MAMKSDNLFMNEKCHHQIDRDTQFINLNLNQSHQSPKTNHVQSYSKPSSNKDRDEPLYYNNNHKKQNKQSWKKSTKDSSLKTWNDSILYDTEEKEAKKRWMKNSDTKSSSNSSTLSLHIAAYENGIKDAKKNKDSTKKSKNSLQFTSSQLKDPFEYPRQMNAPESDTPELMQFRASQRLISPNQGTNAAAADALSLHTGTSASFVSSINGDNINEDERITDFEQARLIESIVHLQDILDGNLSHDSDLEGSDEDYVQSTVTSDDDFLLYTPADSSDSDTTIAGEGFPRAEVVAATLDQIQQLLEEAHTNNILSEAAWTNLPENEEPASMATRAFRGLIHLPFTLLTASAMGILNFNLMLLKIPLIPFYILRRTLYAIATIFASSPSVEENHENGNNDGNELRTEPTQNDSTYSEGGEEEQYAGRQLCGGGGEEFEDNLDFGSTGSTELNGISEYNESIAGGRLDGESLSENEVQYSDAYRLPPADEYYYSSYIPDNFTMYNQSDVEVYRTFFDPPTQILESPERRDIDTPAPLPLYDLHHRQGNNDQKDL